MTHSPQNCSEGCSHWLTDVLTQIDEGDWCLPGFISITSNNWMGPLHFVLQEPSGALSGIIWLILWPAVWYRWSKTFVPHFWWVKSHYFVTLSQLNEMYTLRLKNVEHKYKLTSQWVRSQQLSPPFILSVFLFLKSSRAPLHDSQNNPCSSYPGSHWILLVLPPLLCL